MTAPRPQPARPALTYTPATGDDPAAYADLIARVFQWKGELTSVWTREHGHQHIRLVKDRDGICGGLLLMPMGQFFGGRRVSLCGIVTVVVPPEMRGRGVGKELMRAAVREMKDAGHALSGLYPATLPVYRAAGYEEAGVRCVVRINLKQSPAGPAPEGAEALAVRAYTPAHEPLIRDLYARLAPRTDGFLDRPESIWTLKVHRWRGEPTSGYVIFDDATCARAVGCVFLHQLRPGLAPFDMHITDLHAEDGRAAWRLMALLSDHWSVAGEAIWMTGPSHPALLHIRDRGPSTAVQDRWMLRVLDPVKAFTQRGYAPELTGEVSFTLRDPGLPENSGDYTLRVRDGVGELSPGGAPRATLSERALAALASGYATPQWLAGSGLASGDTAALDRLARLCTLPTPWMSEIY